MTLSDARVYELLTKEIVLGSLLKELSRLGLSTVDRVLRVYVPTIITP